MDDKPTQRADEQLVAQGLAESRTQAKALIERGSVLLNGTPITKASKRIPEGTWLELTEKQRFVSRAGNKLEAFLEAYPTSVEGLVVLDIGASTGGFTDCLLQRGASEVTCIDVGHGQLHPSLQFNPRVINLERTNARALSTVQLPHEVYPRIVMDLSFISLTKVLPEAWKRLAAGGILIALIKPQFEATPALIKKGKGILKDNLERARIREAIQDFCLKELSGAQIIGTLESPLPGGDGNIEYLLGLKRT
jgi:23S rRNA (cytidine1920-2'-O)/16S rRNA (cytidine1409-2'-O)-methyltransferase